MPESSAAHSREAADRAQGLRILFDANWWFDGPPSGKNVLRSVISTWSQEFPDDELTLEVPRHFRARFSEVTAAVPGSRVRPRPFRNQAANVILRAGLGGHYDSAISQNFVSPFSRQHRTVFMHDAIFQEHPEWFSRLERLYLSVATLLLPNASLVVTSSKAEAARISRMNRNLSTRVEAVGLAVPDGFVRAASQKPSLELDPKAYILTVGRLNVRKNLEALALSLSENDMISTKFPLILVGSRDGVSGLGEGLKRSVDEGAVIFAGQVSDGELKWLYENCRLFVFPSLDEGFGLPVLEAAISGAPQALSNIDAFREFGAVGAFFDPVDRNDMAVKVSSMLSSESVRNKSTLREEYSWTSMVTRLRARILHSIGPGIERGPTK